MLQARISSNQHFRDYVAHLLELHRLIAAGNGDSATADEIRDQMDSPWDHLSLEEINLVDRLSADLYTVGVDRDFAAAQSQSHFELRKALDESDWGAALELASLHENELSRAEVAFLRGICWMNLGQPDAALPFLREAVHLRSDDAHQFWLLMCLVQSGNTAEAADRAMAIAQASTDPALLLQATTVLSVRAGELEPPHCQQLLLVAIDCGERGLALAKVPGVSPTIWPLRLGTRLHLALNYESVGRHDMALKHCREVLEADSNNLDALIIYGRLSYDQNPKSEQNQFLAGRHKDMANRLPVELLNATAWRN